MTHFPSSFLILVVACACPEISPDSGDVDAGGLDAPSLDVPGAETAEDANEPDVTLDAPEVDANPGDVPSPFDCMGEAVMNAAGTLTGSAFGEAFDFPFIAVGIETDRGESCPHVFIRAGESADFNDPITGRYFELNIPYTRGAAAPGVVMGTLNWSLGSGPMSEEVMVDVQRADGLFETDVPLADRRVEFSIAHHDATTDFDGEATVSTYCINFPMCL